MFPGHTLRWTKSAMTLVHRGSRRVSLAGFLATFKFASSQRDRDYSHNVLLSVDRGVAVSFVLVDIVDLQLQVGTANYSCGYLVGYKVPQTSN